MADLSTGSAFVAGTTIVASAMNTRFTNIETWAKGTPDLSTSGSMTTVKGTLNVDEAVTFDATLGVTGTATFSGNIDVDGTTNLDAVDIDGNVQLDGTLTVGVNDTGHNVTFYGATDGAYMKYDQAADRLIVLGGEIGIGTASPAKPLDIVTASGDAYIKQSDGTTTTVFGPAGNSSALWGTTSNHDIYFIVNNTEKLRLKADGTLNSSKTYTTTTSTSANMVVDSSPQGDFKRSTSSIKFKTDVETMDDDSADAVLNLRPVSYKSLCSGDDKDRSHWGFIAEEVVEIDSRLVHFGPNGEADGVQYDRVIPALVNVIKRQEARITALEA